MRLAGARKIVKSRFCPSFFHKRDEFKYEALVGMGGNIGDSAKRFDKFIRVITSDSRFHVVEVSPILINAAFGYEAQDDFSNAVINLQTSMSPRNLLKILRHYESKFKRVRTFKNAPRTLDLDILYFSKKVYKTPRLIVPHPGADKRLSVIVPLGLMRG